MADVSYNKPNTNRTKWSWLRRNKFYEQTPLHGFSFIQEAKTIFEVSIWYSLTFAFSVLTIVNLYQAILNYLSNPTLTHVRHTATTTGVQLTNFSIVVKISWADLTQHTDPTKAFYHSANLETIEWAENLHNQKKLYVPHLYACFASQQEKTNLPQHLLDLSTIAVELEANIGIREPWNQLLKVRGRKKPRLVNLANPRLLVDWKKQLSAHADQLYKFWIKHNQTLHPWPEHLWEVHNMMLQIVHTRPKNLFLKMMLLNALNDNSDPRNHLKQTMSETYEEWSEPYSFNSSASDIIRSLGSTPAQLLDDVLQSLSRTFAFKITNSQEAAVYLHGIHFEKNENQPNTTGLFKKDDLKLEFQVILPANTDMMVEKIRIEFHSFFFKWFMYIFRSFFLYYNHGIHEAAGDDYASYKSQTYCDLEQSVKVTDRLYEETRKVELYYNHQTVLSIDTPNANRITLETLDECKLIIVPIDEFYSKTTGCYNHTYERCIDECVNGKYLMKCSCYSWRHQFLNINTTNHICNTFCKPSEEVMTACKNQCVELVRHPCHLSKYNLQFGKCKAIQQFDEDKPLVAFEYEKPKIFNHPQFYEEYALTAGSFMGHLGGVFDFWMGLNVIGLLHLIVFAFKKITQKFNPFPENEMNLDGKKIREAKAKHSFIIEKYNSKLHSLQEDLRKIEDNKKQESQLDERNLWRWLRSNDFFEETPLAGYKFITLSKSIAEVVIWYGLIMIFTTFTIYNLCNAVTHYNSSPTRSFVTPVTSTQNISLVNFSIVVDMPLLEFIEIAPFKINVEPPFIKTMNYLPHYFACFAGQPDMNDLYIWKIYDSLKQSWHTKEVEEWLNEVKIRKSHKIMQTLKPDLLNDWKEKLQWHSDQLRKYWIHHYKTIISYLSFPEYETIISQVESLLNLYLSNRPQHTLFKLLFLNTLKDGDVFEQTELFAAGNFSMAGRTLLQELGSTPKELLVDVLEELNQIIHIHVQHAPGAQVYLNDYRIIDSTTQRFTYRILLPHETDQIEIGVHSSLFMWFHYIIQTFEDYYQYVEKHDPTVFDHQQICTYDYLAEYKNAPKTDMDLWTWGRRIDLLRKVFAALYYQHAKLSIESNTGERMDLDAINRHELILTPRIQFLSQVKNCYPETFEICVDKCLNAAHLDACNCYPWTLYYLNLDNRNLICPEPCPSIIESKCKEECSRQLRHSCKADLYDLYKNDVSADTYGSQAPPWKPVISFRLKKQKVFNHPQFIEEYAMSPRDFISELGGLLDFWIGMNVIAAIHLVVYLMKQCKHSSDKKSKTGKIVRMLFFETSDATNSIRMEQQPVDKKTMLRNILHRIDALQMEMDNDAIITAMKGERVKKLKQEKQKFRFPWLWQNSFFEETSLTGYSFIQTSTSIAEGLFWYMVIVTFSAITVNNLMGVIKHYMSKPTINMIIPTASTDHLEIANFSIHLELPILDIIGQHPMRLGNEKGLQFQQTDWIPQYFACNTGSKYEDDYQYLLFLVVGAISEEWVKLLDDHNNQISLNSNSYQQIDFSSKHILKQWRRTLQTSANDLHKFLTWNQNKRVTKNMQTVEKTIEEIYLKPIQIQNDTALKFMLLESLGKSIDFREKLLKDIELPMSDVFGLDFESSENFKSNVAQHTKNLKITPSILVSQALNDLSNIIHIDAGNVATNIEVEKWSYTAFEDQNYFLREWMNKYRHRIDLKIELLEHVSQVQIEIRSFRLLWHQYVMGTFKRYFMNLKQSNETMYDAQSLCDQDYDYETVLENQQNGIEKFYDNYGIIYIDTNRGQILQLGQNGHYDIVLNPSSHYSSKIDNCFNETYDECVQLCDNAAHLKKCNCYPWVFYNLNRNPKHAVCSEPCEEAKEELVRCERKCEDKIRHACRRSFYKMEKTLISQRKDPNSVDDLDVPFVTLNIRTRDVFVHPQFIEDYQMNIGMFMSEIGSIVDFWLGLNIVGVLHMATYFFRQCFRKELAVQPEQDLNAFKRVFKKQLKGLRKETKRQYIRLSTGVAR